jgi:O-antigen/teichoic acid export membrane protein
LFNTILKGSGVFFIFQILDVGIRFFIQIFIAGKYGAESYGVFSTGNSFIITIATILALGMNIGVLKNNSQNILNNSNENNGLAVFAITVATLVSLIYLLATMAYPGMLHMLVDNEHFINNYVGYYKYGPILFLLITILGAIARSNLNSFVYVISKGVSYNALFALCLIASVYYSSGFEEIVILYLVCIGISAAFIFFLLRSVVFDGNKFKHKLGFMKFSGSFYFIEVFWLFRESIILLIVGNIYSMATVGVFAMASKIPSLLSLPSAALNTLFAPYASACLNDKRTHDLEDLYKKITFISIGITVPFSVLIYLYSDVILRIIGDNYTTGSFIMKAYVVAKLIGLLAGPSGIIIQMSGRAGLETFNTIFMALLIVLTNYLLFDVYGIEGIAIATAGSIAFIDLLRIVEVWIIHKFSPFSKNLAIVIAVSIVCLMPMYIMNNYFSNYITNSIVYVSCYLLFVVNYFDVRKVYNELILG